MAGFLALQNAHVTHRKGKCTGGGATQHSCHAPAQRIVIGNDRSQQPGGRIDHHPRLGAERETGPRIQQVRQGAAGFGGRDIDEGFIVRFIEIQPEITG